MKATIALDRSSGAILKTAGQISLVHTAKSQQQAAQQEDTPQPFADGNAAVAAGAATGAGAAGAVGGESQGAEELAGMVWGFVNAAGGLVEGLDDEVSVFFLLSFFPLSSPPFFFLRLYMPRPGCLQTKANMHKEKVVGGGGDYTWPGLTYVLWFLFCRTN